MAINGLSRAQIANPRSWVNADERKYTQKDANDLYEIFMALPLI